MSYLADTNVLVTLNVAHHFLTLLIQQRTSFAIEDQPTRGTAI